MLIKRSVALAATALAAVAALGASTVADARPTPGGATTRNDATTATDRGPVVDHERGIVLEGTGRVGDLTAYVTVYENSLHGNSVQVVLGDDQIGYAESATPYLVGTALHATASVDGKEAVVTGTLVESGRTTRVVEPIQDNGEQIVTRGTHTALTGDVTVSWDGVVVPLEVAPAFRYDLETRRVALFGR